MAVTDPGARKVARSMEEIDNAVPEESTPAEDARVKERNLSEWKKSMSDPNLTPAARKVLVEERRNNPDDFTAGNDDPLGFAPGGPDKAKTDPLGFTRTEVTDSPDTPVEQPAAPRAQTLRTMQPGASQEGTFGTTMEGAVTGRTAVPTRSPAPQGGIGPGGARIAVETGGAALGGTVGMAMGGPLGMRLGEGAGAAAGSLVSETFDPTEHPIGEALQTGALTITTGAIASGGAKGLRALVGKPSEVGKEVVKMMEKRGEIPPAAAVFDSGFVRDMQSVGSASFAIGHRIEQVNKRAVAAASEDLGGYVNSFQRFYQGSKDAFAKAEAMLPTKRVIPIGRDTIDAVEGLVSVWEKEGMLAKASPLVLELRAAIQNKNIRGLRLSIEDAQELESMLFTRAREMERSAKMGNVDAGGTSLIGKRYEVAYDVRAKIDGAIDTLIANRQVPTIAKPLLAEGRAMWKMWKQGELVETMVAQATKDIEGDALASGNRLLSEIDKIAKRQEGLTFSGAGRKQQLLADDTINNLRRYAQVLKAVEESGREGGFQLAARRGQLVGITKMASVGAGAGAATGGVAGAGVGAAVGASMGILTPPALAYIFSNKQAMGLLIRGLKLDPASAAFARTSREFVTMLVNEGVMPPDRVEQPE